MKVAIYGRKFGEDFSPFVQELFDYLHQNNIDVIIYEPFLSFLKPRITFKEKPEYFTHHSKIRDNADFLISIGGDGTMLGTLPLVRNYGIPVVGINAGRLGFLSNIQKEQIKEVVDALVNKTYKLDSRNLLKLVTKENLFGNTNYALNELTVHKKDSSSMITIHCYIDNEYLNSYWADGLIVSTPTGSTAYSLSCGGPIVAPGSDNFIITPIAPHNLTVRPVVVSDKKEIKLVIEGRSDEFLVSLDSRSETISSNSEIIIRKANSKMTLVQLENQSYFKTTRNKLLWGLDKRN